MHRKLHWAFRLMLIAAVMSLAPLARAGTSGKLEGHVTNEKNEPLAGVNLRIEGQRLGAVTDEKGYYFVLGVPAGEYSVHVNLMGFGAYVADHVQVSPDFTTPLNVTLKTEAVQMGEVRVDAARPLLQKDATGTTRFLEAGDLAKMPTRGYRDAAAQQTGVVDFHRQIDNETQNGNTLIIRGGRPNETAYFVDGFSQQDPLTGTSSTSISNNAIEEVVVLTGGFNAEYGRIMSGAVNVVTREGTPKYSGSLEAVSDALAGNWVSANRTDYNVYDASFGGPVMPGYDRLNFYVSGERRWEGDRNPTFMTDAFKNQLTRLNKSTDVKPNNSSGGFTFQGKLGWQLNDKMTLKAGGLGSEDLWREYSHIYLLNDATHMPKTYDRNASYYATFNHVLSAKTFYNLGTNFFQTLRKRGDGVNFDRLGSYYIRRNPTYPFYEPLFWNSGHVFNNYLQRNSSYYGVQGAITSQFDRYNQVKAGMDYQRHTLRYLQHYRPTLNAADLASGFYRDWDGYGYDLKPVFDGAGTLQRVDIVETADGSKDGPKHPKTWSTFVQDKYERQGVIANVGLRYDYINVDTPALQNDIAPLENGPYADSLDTQDLTANKVYTRISPRLGVSFPVDERTQLRFNYGQFYQQPNLQDLYVSYRFLEYKLQTGGYYVGFGNPNLKPEHTTAYEVSFARQLGERMRLDITAYYKDVQDLVEVTSISPRPGVQSKSFTSFRNRDFATIRGVDVGFLMRRTNHISSSVNYSLSFAQGTGSVSNTQRNIAWIASEPPKQTAPLDYDQRHKVSMNMDFGLEKGEGPRWGNRRPLENFGINVIYNVASGTPYTPTQVYNELTLGNVAPTPTGPINSRYGPWTQTLDLKASRDFTLGTLNFQGFLWVLNAFDIRNPVAVYTSTGSPDTDGWLNTNDGRGFVEGVGGNPSSGSAFNYSGLDGNALYRLAESDPTLFANPRLVRFGFRTSF